jgi:hypothetical protein
MSARTLAEAVRNISSYKDALAASGSYNAANAIGQVLAILASVEPAVPVSKLRELAYCLRQDHRQPTSCGFCVGCLLTALIAAAAARPPVEPPEVEKLPHRDDALRQREQLVMDVMRAGSWWLHCSDLLGGGPPLLPETEPWVARMFADAERRFDAAVVALLRPAAREGE